MNDETKTKKEIYEEKIRALQEKVQQEVQRDKLKADKLTKRVHFLLGEFVSKRLRALGRVEFNLDEFRSELRPVDRTKFDEWIKQLRAAPKIVAAA